MGCGRYDFTLGMEDTVLAQSDFLHPPAVAPILAQLLGPSSEWISYPGGLPAEGNEAQLLQWTCSHCCYSAVVPVNMCSLLLLYSD